MGFTSEDINTLERLFDNKLQPLYVQVNERFEQVNKRLDESTERTEARFEQIDKRFEQIDKRFEQMDKRFEQIDKRFEQIDKRFEQIDEKFRQIDKRFEQVEESIRGIKVQLNKVETRLDNLEKDLAIVKSDLEQTKCIIENEIQRNIKIVAENHVDLSRKFTEALSVSQTNELYHLKVNQLETRLVLLENKFDSLAQHMDEMRKARHDLRQHLAVVQSYIEKDDKEGLHNYIELYKNELPHEVLDLYCRNDVVNAVISYYAGVSRDNGIHFDAKADYPELSSITETDMTVLLGNLLENAVEACLQQKDEQPFIKVRIKRHGNSELLILIDNTCKTSVRFMDGLPLSSKRPGMGIGAASVQDIAARYNGTVRFEQRKEVFYASVLIQYDSQI